MAAIIALDPEQSKPLGSAPPQTYCVPSMLLAVTMAIAAALPFGLEAG